MDKKLKLLIWMVGMGFIAILTVYLFYEFAPGEYKQYSEETQRAVEEEITEHKGSCCKECFEKVLTEDSEEVLEHFSPCPGC